MKTNLSVDKLKATREYVQLLNMYVDQGFSVEKAERMAMSDMLLEGI